MKNTKRFIAVALMAIMMLGATFTAMAANGSMEEITAAEKVANMKIGVYFKVTVPAGVPNADKITIAEITDEKIIASAYDRSEYVASVVTQDIQKDIKPEKNVDVIVVARQIFDVQGVKSGQVTLSLGESGKDYKGRLVVASHYNTTTQKWEQMDKLPEIDENGCITINFNSYSPIMISVLNINKGYLKPGSKYLVEETTMNPQQVLEGADTKSPKMGE